VGQREDLVEAFGVQKASRHGWFTFEVEGIHVHLLLEGALEEARHRGVPLGGKYSARLDPPHTPSDQRHIHIYARGNELCAINLDGSTRHGRSGQRIPSKAADAIRAWRPEWRLPPGNVLERCDPPSWLRHTLVG